MDRLTHDRYQRQIVLPDFGTAGQQQLLKAKVLVVGAGGLGVPVLQYLTGMGIGTIGIVDGDLVSLSNLHRQVLYSEADIGKFKAKRAEERLHQLNSAVVFQSFTEMLTPLNAHSILRGYDVVVDCTDDIATRYLINDTCVELRLPFVYGALYRHEGQVSVFNYKGSPTYRDAFPDDSVTVENCNEIGVLGALPGIIGSYQSMEVIKILTGLGSSLAGKLLIVDIAKMEHTIFQLSNRKHQTATVQSKEDFLSWDEVRTISVADCHFIDIRSASQFNADRDDRFENIPIEDLTGFTPSKSKVVLVCQQGKSSRQAATILKFSFPELQVYQIKGGYNSL